MTSLLLGIAAGIVMYRSDFCVTAMFRDLFLVKDASMMRYLVVIIIVSMALFESGRLTGIITIYPFPLLGTPSVTTFLAGILFGLGMVLAGGCVVGTLYKIGGGSVLSMVALAGLLTGSALYAEFHPNWAQLAAATQLTESITLPEMLNIPPTLIITPIVIIGSYILYSWWKSRLLIRVSYAEGYLQPVHTAIILSFIGFVSYLIIGMPLGITTSYAKLGASVESIIAPEHVNSLAYFSASTMNYVPPFASEAISGGAGPSLDAIAAIQYPLIIGIIAGAFMYSIKLGEFKLYYKLPHRQYISAITGGIILGMSARMTPGCNIWHLWGGVPILAGQSIVFFLGLFPGAWLGSIVFKRLVIKDE
ncbi:MAG TPA: YeeE/YedE family protein [Gammaproteobacteria bacterium]